MHQELSAVGEDTRFVIIEANNHDRLCAWWQAQPPHADTKPFVLNVDRRKEGVWSGVRDIFLEILDQEEGHNDALISRHDYELFAIMVEQKERIRPRFLCLTDVSHRDERVRIFPMDRAFRIVAGLVDMLAEWHAGRGPLMFVLSRFDHMSDMTRLFFKELMRRKSALLDMRFRIMCEPGGGDAAAQFVADLYGDAPIARVTLEDEAAPPMNQAEASARIEALESRLDHAPMVYYPELIELYTLVGEADKARKAHAFCLSLLAHHGYNTDAYYHGERIMDEFDAVYEEEVRRMTLAVNFAYPMIVKGKIDEAYDFVKSKGYDAIRNPDNRVRSGYLLSMIKIRFAEVRDIDMAEHFLDQALTDLENAHFEDEKQRIFLRVFLNNGMALIRVHQRRPQEAIDLCRNGFETLTKELGTDTHKLHRSVLLYNIAQVNMRLKNFTEAIQYLSDAIEMDPNYSEYYNDRGNIYLGMEDHVAALADYQKAIERSAPYFEVFHNIGLCLQKMGRYDEALAAYEKSLDLEPDQVAIYLSVAEIYQEQEHFSKALAQYDAALSLQMDAETLSDRAIVLYHMGRSAEALADLNRAIDLKPENPGYYYNRSVALEDLGRYAEALMDLKRYQTLAGPDEAEDIGEKAAMLESKLVPAT